MEGSAAEAWNKLQQQQDEKARKKYGNVAPDLSNDSRDFDWEGLSEIYDALAKYQQWAKIKFMECDQRDYDYDRIIKLRQQLAAKLEDVFRLWAHIWDASMRQRRASPTWTGGCVDCETSGPGARAGDAV